MALNFSRGSNFSTPLEKSLCPSMGSVFDCYLIKNYGRLGNSCSLCSFNGSLEGNPCFEVIKAVLGDIDDPGAIVVDDILDNLPRDPFGMDIKSTFTAISDWFEDFERVFRPGYEVFGLDETHKKFVDHQQILGLNWGWNGSKNFQPQKDSAKSNEVSVSCDAFNGYQNSDGLYDGGIVADENVGDFLTVSHGEADESQNCAKIDCDDAQGGVPHDALFFVLGYLGVQDLLSIEQVCKSFRDVVRGDPLLWRTIHIGYPLNMRITDETLIKLTGRAQGTLQCLVLVNCVWITDSGLGCVLQSNPRLMKLSVPDCMKLTIEGMLFNIRALKSSGTPGIKHLRIGGHCGVYDVTLQQFEELKDLLGADKYLQQRDQKPQFYHGRYSHIIFDDGRAIDIDVCPRCQRLRPVYDCPAESCQQDQAGLLCRGCTLCIERCIHCGRCIKDYDYEETLCRDLFCLDCWNKLLHCPEKSVEKEATKCTVTMYQFCLYG